MGTVALLACGAQALLSEPVPRIQDEFSYLLAADTFAAGRLTNPTHPLWEAFRAPHILQRPTYQSKYPPAPALPIAAGQVVTGSPLVGLWLNVALACVATFWMLRTWLPPPWALLGGLLAATHPVVVIDWGAEYTSGPMAMLGGALLLGGLRLLLDRPGPAPAVALGSGLLVLAASRPFEGLVASLPVAGLLGWRLVRRPPPRPVTIRRLLLPLAGTLLLGACWLGYYNYRVTGNPLRMPYQEYLEQRAGEERIFVGYPSDRASATEKLHKLARRVTWRLGHRAAAQFFLGLPVVLLALPWTMRGRWNRVLMLVTAAVLGVDSLAVNVAAHYSAPITAGAIALLVASLVAIRRLRPRSLLVRLGLTLFAIAWVTGTAVVGLTTARADSTVRMGMLAGEEQPEPSQAIVVRQWHLERLRRDGRRHLVLVRYPPDSRRYREWVYNRADIDGASVVWADASAEGSSWMLLEYFDDRLFWLVEPETAPFDLRRYVVPEQPVWLLRAHAEARAEIGWLSDDESWVRVEIARGGSIAWHLQLERRHPAVEVGKRYAGRFEARADGPVPITVEVSQAHFPWRNLGLERRLLLTPEWRAHPFEFEAAEADRVTRLLFGLGSADGAVEIRNVRFD